ncbi:DUF771 domain-containing protein [Lacticaseibacillus jixiensis]|uniref:DUF771 domain-containing protein n=1 Tax=Lacticaseibacillus jixiensis TaxID=3231926 RepID=UPI0036F41307
MSTEYKALTLQQVVTVQVPADKVLIDRDEYEDLQKRANLNCWWTLNDVSARYKRKPDWIVSHILKSPTFEPQLRRKLVMYDHDGGKGYLFEPMGFSEWMREHFNDIANEVGR